MSYCVTCSQRNMQERLNPKERVQKEGYDVGDGRDRVGESGGDYRNVRVGTSVRE